MAFDMDQNDEASFYVGVSGGTKTVDISGDSAQCRTFFSGFLVQ